MDLVYFRAITMAILLVSVIFHFIFIMLEKCLIPKIQPQQCSKIEQFHLKHPVHPLKLSAFLEKKINFFFEEVKIQQYLFHMQWLKEEEDFSYFNIKISNIFNIKLKFALLLQKIITYSCPINMMSFNDTKVASFYLVMDQTYSGDFGFFKV